MKNYDATFDVNVKGAIAAQKTDSLFASSHCVMIGNGQLWFNLLCNRKAIKITSISN